jgi:small-conductance mechanosensitive channel
LLEAHRRLASAAARNPEVARKGELGMGRRPFCPAAAFLLVVVYIAAPAAASPGPGAGVAATATDERAPEADAASLVRLGDPPAELVVYNRPVVVLRATVMGFTPQERVARAKRRLDEMLEHGRHGPLEVVPIPQGLVVMLADTRLFFLARLDVDEIHGETAEGVAVAAVAILEEAIEAERLQRRPQLLLRGFAFSAAATVFLLAVLRALAWLWRKLAARVLWLGHRLLPRAQVAGFRLLSGRTAAYLAKRTLGALIFMGGGFLSYLWLAFCLDQFPFSQPWAEALGSYLVKVATTITGGVLGLVPGLFFVLVIVLLTRAVVRGINGIFEAVEEGRLVLHWLHADVAGATRRLVVAALWICALVVAYPYLPGSGTDAFKGVSVFIGIVVSLGSTGIVNQAMSGMILTYSRALKQGEYVRVGDTEGTVLSVGMLSTKILTVKQEEVTIPNTVMISTTTKNFTRSSESGGPVLHASVTIGYSTPWRQIHAMLREAAAATPGLLSKPQPFVIQTALSDFYVEYQLNAVIEHPETRVQTLSLLNATIQDVFNRHGVQIMSPHYRFDPPEKVWVPRERWHEPPAEPDAEGDRSTPTDPRGRGTTIG